MHGHLRGSDGTASSEQCFRAEAQADGRIQADTLKALLSFCLQIGTVKEPKLRVQIVSQRSVFDENPADFRAKYDQSQVGGGCVGT